MITQNNSINKSTSIIVVLMMVFSLISISTIKSFGEVGDVIEEGNFKFTVLDKNSVSLTDVIDKTVSGEQIIPQEVEVKTSRYSRLSNKNRKTNIWNLL